MDKYIATVETKNGTEVVCTLKPKQEVGTLEEVRNFLFSSLKSFPDSIYRICKLEETNYVK